MLAGTATALYAAVDEGFRMVKLPVARDACRGRASSCASDVAVVGHDSPTDAFDRAVSLAAGDDTAAWVVVSHQPAPEPSYVRSFTIRGSGRIGDTY